ncbi:uncharacterized protein LOC143085169 isoform X3 [Mytilus galloprovincialis]|uniref:uncharacterized protein LOC143085169 isoform X3 n=1 Tax=Mytilus galloprovincialis TaxID=29158 RepID=UPI003F7CD243
MGKHKSNHHQAQKQTITRDKDNRMSNESLILSIEEDHETNLERWKKALQNVHIKWVLIEPFRRLLERLLLTFPRLRKLGRCLLSCCKCVLDLFGFSNWTSRKRSQPTYSESDDDPLLNPSEAKRQRLENQIGILQTQLGELTRQNEGLCNSHHEETTRNQREIEQLQQWNKSNELRITELIRERDELKKAKDEALSRLSEMMGVKLRENNPAITDLNDPNRPMKLGEQFNELYENEWTEAFLELQDLKTDDTSLNEEQAVTILLNILKETNEQGIAELTLQLSGLLQSVQGLPEDDIKDFIKSIKDAYKANSGKYASLIHKKISTDALHCPTVVKYFQCCESYIENCAKICYLAAVQDPPMLLHFDPDNVYDKQIFKEYTTMGRRVKFLVWPALFLHKGGPLLSKGVVQPLPDVD